MQQHAVPQNVTQYQFRLVGDMTLKQFLELAGGLVLAYLCYSSNLIFIIKWPLALISILGGFGLAFFPIEDRPLDQWLTNFLRSIYSPTRYIWKKSNKVPHVFTFEPHPIVETVTATKTVKAPTLSNFKPGTTTDVTDEERQKLNVLDAMLAKATPTTPSPPPPKVEIEKPSVTIRRLKPISQVQKTTIFQSAPRPTATQKPLTISLSDKDVAIPQKEATKVTKSPVEDAPKVEAPSVIFTKPAVSSKPVAATITPETIRLPAAPTAPNLVVGMVVNKEGKIVENAIVQIVTQDGIPARAIKTNSLGQFYTSTPLSSGTYTIETEKEGFVFPPNKLVISNTIVSPLLLKAN